MTRLLSCPSFRTSIVGVRSKLGFPGDEHRTLLDCMPGGAGGGPFSENLLHNDWDNREGMMKKAIVLILALGLLAGASSMPATAKKKKKAKPVATTLYMHSAMPVGEVESTDGLLAGTYMTMDATEPTNPVPSSMQLLGPTPAFGPNTDCAGNQLFPIWVGKVSGTVKGTMKATFDVVASGGTVDVRVWPDVQSLMCDGGLDGSASSYVQPVGQQEVELPVGPGTVEVEFEKVNFKAVSSMMFQITPLASPPYGRVFYDSADFAARLEFPCIPASGKSCTP